MVEIKSLLKVKSAIRASFSINKIATVLHTGDEDNGSILLKIRRKDSKSCLLGKSLSVDGKYSWCYMSGNIDEWFEENIINEKIDNELKIDPDLWVLELESETIWNPLELV
tara:strand:+ start:398 stop:730 length:333 start_codon:yes stop_codon:yes gene_type:complete